MKSKFLPTFHFFAEKKRTFGKKDEIRLDKTLGLRYNTKECLYSYNLFRLNHHCTIRVGRYPYRIDQWPNVIVSNFFNCPEKTKETQTPEKELWEF